MMVQPGDDPTWSKRERLLRTIACAMNALAQLLEAIHHLH